MDEKESVDKYISERTHTHIILRFWVKDVVSFASHAFSLSNEVYKNIYMPPSCHNSKDSFGIKLYSE